MTESTCSFVLANDIAMLELLVGYLQEQVIQMELCDENDCMRIGVALQEALVNALHHGNLQVGSELRETSHDAYLALIARRCGESPYRDRRIHVSARLTRDEATFTIRDEGVGFNLAALPDPRDPANLEKASGRGVFLMQSFMDDVQFEDRGRLVTLVKRSRRAGAAGPPPSA